MLIKLGQIVAAGTAAWFLMLIRWIDRNPEWADQIRRNECPLPWFFKVWRVLVICSSFYVSILIGHCLIQLIA